LIFFLSNFFENVLHLIYPIAFAQERIEGKKVWKISESKEMIQSDVEVEVKDSLNFANIYINDCGENIKLEIRQRLRELCQKKIEAINLYLDICDENTVHYTEDIEELGFFFAGVFPNDKKQYLVLQYLNNVPIDYKRIVLVSDFAQELGAYVKKCDPNQKQILTDSFFRSLSFIQQAQSEAETKKSEESNYRLWLNSSLILQPFECFSLA